jgi:hypothetical protein
MIEGKVYRIVAKHTDDVYIGSTVNEYASQRMACHRHNDKIGIGNYGDLFCDKVKSPPWLEVLEICEIPSADDTEMLRMKERDYIEAEPNTVNIRCAYLTPKEREEQRKIAVDKYQNTNKGKIAMAKAKHNQSVKRYQCKVSALEEKLKVMEGKKNEWFEAYKDLFHQNQIEIIRLECKLEDLLSKLEHENKKSTKE